jgi:signal transduction histidine kinase
MTDRIEGVRTIIRAGHHLQQIINDILDLSKIEAGRLEVERVPVALLGVIRDVVSLTRLRADEKGLEFRVDFEFPLPERVCTDLLRLKQVLLNLLGNAIKFTERGRVELKVRCEPLKERLFLEVMDTVSA